MASDTLVFLIEAIYSAAADPSKWPIVAELIQHAIGGHSVNLVLDNPSGGRFTCIFTNGISDQEVERYLKDIKDRDEMTGLIDRIPEGMAFASQNFFDKKKLHSLYSYDQFYENIGYTYCNVGVFYRNDNRRGWISVSRSENDALFSPDEQLLMQRLTPHLKRAFFINIQLLEAQQSSEVALDSLEHIAAAAVLLAKNGKVVQHNTRAEPYLRGGGGSIENSVIRLPDAKANHRLKEAIAAFDQGAGYHEGVIPFVEHGVRKTALCFPWRSSQAQLDWLGIKACCIVFILTPCSSTSRTLLLQKTFDLSQAELKVLLKLMDGKLVADVASDLFVSKATVRFHIRSLLRKTKCRSQIEMISQVFNTVSMQVG